MYTLLDIDAEGLDCVNELAGADLPGSTTGHCAAVPAGAGQILRHTRAEGSESMNSMYLGHKVPHTLNPEP